MKRNILHFSPEKNWINDPNGLVYYNGEYHLFYQHNPFDMVWGPMHWGHAVSTDMVNWRHLPIALYPDELGTIFSGSVVIDWNDSSGFFNGSSGLVAIFTQHSDKEEVQSIAYSNDNGRSWIKYKDNPVIKNPGFKDFRDPKVLFHSVTNKWIAVIACGRCLRFYSSLNLIDWHFESEFGDNELQFEGPWECPDLFELETDHNPVDKKWVLKIDLGNGSFAGGSGGFYLIGDFDGKSFTKDPGVNFKWIDYSQDFYASQTIFGTFEEQNRKLWIGWMNNWQYANVIPAVDFRGIMTLPRELSIKKLSNKLFLAQKPAVEIVELREKVLLENDFTLSANKIYRLYNNYKAVEVASGIKYDSNTRFNIVISFGNNECVIIKVDGECNRITLDRSNSGNTQFSNNFKGVFEAEPAFISDFIKMNIIIDLNTIELFVNDGTLCLSSLIFPNDSIKHIELISQSGCTFIKSLEIYGLKKKNLIDLVKKL